MHEICLFGAIVDYTGSIAHLGNVGPSDVLMGESVCEIARSALGSFFPFETQQFLFYTWLLLWYTSANWYDMLYQFTVIPE